jgi:hypothetical protein
LQRQKESLLQHIASLQDIIIALDDDHGPHQYSSQTLKIQQDIIQRLQTENNVIYEELCALRAKPLV